MNGSDADFYAVSGKKSAL